ncbi:MAG: 8-amino-7-oxononanoate synthase [Flavobacterium sp.]|nr:MAG: 8-amino-7-oxononanoate synthase [Flavobacterium sp.]
MKTLPSALANKIAQRTEANALRTLQLPNTLIDFASNDYLGFSQSAAIFDGTHQYLKENGIIRNGATGSRLISGNHSLYEVVENFISDFHQSDTALLFNSGYDANVGFFSSVPQKGDLVLYDEFIHASIRDGIKLGNANSYKFAHNSLEALEMLLGRHREAYAEVYIVTESVFSMDGDCPDIEAMVRLTQKYSCRLIVDEAHALGVIGSKGEGLVQSLGLQESVFARIVTFGKGLGCHGAAVLCAQDLREYLINFARSFIYTTGLPPHSVATILEAYKYLAADSSALNTLKDNVSFFRDEIERLNLEKYFISSASAIHCAVIPGIEKVKFITSVLQQKGCDVKAILSPTVPIGQERLRFCIHSYNTHPQITGVLEILSLTLQE